jgi:hypothetical protein
LTDVTHATVLGEEKSSETAIAVAIGTASLSPLTKRQGAGVDFALNSTQVALNLSDLNRERVAAFFALGIFVDGDNE